MSTEPDLYAAFIAAGRTADVYGLSDSLVVKLYHEGVSSEDVDSERRNIVLARTAGLQTPAVHETISYDGRPGLVLDRIDGTSLLRSVLDGHRVVVATALRLAELHRQVNACPAPTGLPVLSELLHDRIARCEQLTPSDRRSLLRSLHRMPEGKQFCHGDFHPGNVIVENGIDVIIDWVDASRGHPGADLARTSVLFLGSIAVSPPNDKRTAQNEGVPCRVRSAVPPWLARGRQQLRAMDPSRSRRAAHRRHL